MLPGTKPPAYGPVTQRLRSTLIVVGLVILALFLVDKLVLAPPAPPATLAAAIDRLNRHDVRRVTIPAQTVTVELNDGKTLTTLVTADRDLWPAIQRSGADVSVVAGGGARTPLNAYVFQFVPLVVMALLLYALRSGRRRSY